MNILVANLGSTSFKYQVLDMMSQDSPTVLAKGGFERVTDHGEVIAQALEDLRAAGIEPETLSGIGFKTVLGKNLSGCVPGDEAALAALEGFAAVAPAHNPPYAAGIRQFTKLLPEVPRFCLFETAFYQWMPETAKRYAVPQAWHEAGVRRYGFHGASHKANAERIAQLLERTDIAQRTENLYVAGAGEFTGEPLRVVSCHLGGSSSVTALHNGVAVATSMGFSPQSGLPQNNRVGDLDSMAIPFICSEWDISLEEAREQLNAQGGLLGVSDGTCNDLRDLLAAAEDGHQPSQLAIDFLTSEIIRYIGSFMLQMGGLDALVFSGGIGENNAQMRAEICQALAPFGLELSSTANESIGQDEQCEISQSSSSIRAFVLEANEELVVAREVARQLQAR